MEKVYLSETEKAILRKLNVSHYERRPNNDMFNEFSKEEITVALKRLHDLKLVRVNFGKDYIPYYAIILDYGKVYLKENPQLLNPFDDEYLKCRITHTCIFLSFAPSLRVPCLSASSGGLRQSSERYFSDSYD